MPGVEILHSSEVLASGGFNGEIFIFTFIICIIIGFITGIIMTIISLDEGWMIGWLFIGLICGLLLGAIMGDISSTPKKSETHYKVLISDEVSMNEFLGHYEIVDQEGKIYTVKERVEED